MSEEEEKRTLLTPELFIHNLDDYLLQPEFHFNYFEPFAVSPDCHEDELYDVDEDVENFTDLIPERDEETGEIIDYKELIIEEVIEDAKTSVSLKRAPETQLTDVRGSSENKPFWPGGFGKEPSEYSIEDIKLVFEHHEIEDEDGVTLFGEKLLTCPPGFEDGKIFKNDENDTEINLLEVCQNEYENLLDELNLNEVNPDEHENHEVKNIDLKASDNTFNNTFTDNTFASYYDKIKVLNISEVESEKPKKTQWAEILDVSEPITDFEKQIPEPSKRFPFELDTFQKQAIIQLEKNQFVFVAAHTSAGKTVVAEYAIASSKKNFTRTIYTSPIKALSNQKYREFKNEFKSVGLITGDIQIDPTASCLVMTTEILRSMLYGGSEVTRDLEFVILDEVHYINDLERGHVWEEVLILLPKHVTVIMLSATVPNILEFADWVGNTKQRKVYVVCTYKRPVPLLHYIYTLQGGKKISSNIFCIVDGESKFLENNYIQAKNKLKEKEKENKLKIKKSEKNFWNDMIIHLKSDDKLPVITFILSRKRCDDIAKLITVDLNTNKEKSQVHRFFSLCLKKIKPLDQNLPQMIWMKSVLEKGIGVHHSGILPILKEIVEMCFQRGLVKVLFATETFAMGVNMPAKTVIFDSIDKFDGIKNRNLEPSEYIQMAGRAGRRGHDENGTVIIICKQDILPSSDILNNMILGKPEKLTSKFVLRYSMLLNCLRMEYFSVENIMSRSYCEYNSRKEDPLIEKQLKIEREKFSKLKEIGDHLIPLCEFYDVAVDYLENMKILLEKWSPPKIYKELTPGRIIIVTSGTHYNKLGILISMKPTIKVLVLDNDPKNNSYHITDQMMNKNSDELWHKLLSLIPQNKYFYPTNIGYHSLININLTDIQEISKTTIKIDSDIIIKNCTERQMERFKNNKIAPEVINAVSKLSLYNDIYTNHEAKKSQINQLEFIKLEDYCSDLESLEIRNLVMELRGKLNSILPHTNIPNFEESFITVYERKSTLKKIAELEFKKSWKSLSLYTDYCNRLKVLKELNFIDEKDEVELKGSLACEMGQNELILTELISNNLIHGLENPEVAALLSGLICQAKTDINNDEIKEYFKDKSPNLKEAIEKLENINKVIEYTEQKYNVEKSLNERLNFGLAKVFYYWAKDKPFADIMELTDLQEGIIVRCMQQLDELLRDIKTAAKRIGNSALEERMESVSMSIRRDIVFAESLYTVLEN